MLHPYKLSRDSGVPTFDLISSIDSNFESSRMLKRPIHCTYLEVWQFKAINSFELSDMDISDDEGNSDRMDVDELGSGGGGKASGKQQQLSFQRTLPPKAPASSSSSSSSSANAPAPSDLPWVEKYRPSSLDDLIAHEDIISIRKFFSGAVRTI